MSTWRRRGAQFAALISAIAGLLIFATSGTGQAQVPPVVDYKAYPPALPAGCVDGESALANVRFTVNGVTKANLRDFNLVAGDTITMAWDGFNAACAGVGVGLSSKVAQVPVFDQNTDYWLRDFTYCGPEAGATPCAAGANQLVLQVPPAATVPCFQIDAHLGAPLGQVGPTTNYYGVLNGVRSMLISANNGGIEGCGVPLPACATNPAIPAAAYLCAPAVTTTTTAPPPVVTSAPQVPVCALNPALPADSPNCVATTTAPTVPVSAAQLTCTSAQVRDAITGQCRDVQPAAAAALPATGRDTRSLGTTGALFLLSGLCIAYAYRRHGVGDVFDPRS